MLRFMGLVLAVFVLISSGIILSACETTSINHSPAMVLADSNNVSPVIIELNLKVLISSPIMDSDDLTTKAEKIKQAQSSFLDSLKRDGIVVEDVKFFKYIPFVGLTVAHTSLEKLKSHPAVLGVQEDRPVRLH